MSQDDAKRAAARKACEWIRDGMQLGLGTGSTAFHVVERVAELVAGGMKLVAVATSQATARQAQAAGIVLRELNEVESLDLCIDGADEIDPAGNLIKGGGGALTREKLVALAAREMIVVADDSKAVAKLGLAFPLPIEILPFGHQHTLRRLNKWGEPRLRQKDGKPFVTDNAGYIVDLHLENGVAAAEAALLEARIKALPGVIECGLFCNMASKVVLGHPNGQVEVR